jgi:hypothetical protein
MAPLAAAGHTKLSRTAAIRGLGLCLSAAWLLFRMSAHALLSLP